MKTIKIRAKTKKYKVKLSFIVFRRGCNIENVKNNIIKDYFDEPNIFNIDYITEVKK